MILLPTCHTPRSNVLPSAAWCGFSAGYGASHVRSLSCEKVFTVLFLAKGGTWMTTVSRHRVSPTRNFVLWNTESIKKLHMVFIYFHRKNIESRKENSPAAHRPLKSSTYLQNLA